MNFHSWLETQLLLFPETRLVDITHSKLTASSRVQRVALPEGPASTTASMLMAITQQHADVLRGTQLYSIALLDQSDPPKVLSEYPLRLIGESGSGAGGFDSEPPTMEGVTKQLMRHCEGFARQIARSADHADRLFGFMQHENERLHERAERLEARQLETVAMAEEMLSTRHERELAALKASASEARKNQLLQGVNLMLPSVAASFLQKKGAAANKSEATQGNSESDTAAQEQVTMPPTPTVDLGLIAFAQSITPEQLQSLTKTFSTAQMVALAAFLKRQGINLGGQTPKAEAEPEIEPGSGQGGMAN